jgi:hypothetical protein
MQPAGIGIGWPWIAGLALLALVGLLVIWRGLCPRRQGTTPYCRKCGYNLTGTDRTAEDARCSECGSIVTADDAVIFGERVRRWRRVFVGLVIFLLGAVPLVLIGIGVARGVDWYRYKPTAWVLSDLDPSRPSLAARATVELRTRLTGGNLTEAHCRRFAEFCLSEQLRPILERAYSQLAIDALGDLWTQGRLHGERKARFLRNLFLARFSVRPVVAAGSRVPIEFFAQIRAPTSMCHGSSVRQGVLLVDGDSVTYPSGMPSHNMYRAIGGPGACSYRFELLPSQSRGRHVAELGAEFTLHGAIQPDFVNCMRAAGLALSEDGGIKRTLQAGFEVVQRIAEDSVVLKRSPALDDEVSRLVSVRSIGVADTVHGTKEFEGELCITGPLPIGLAFEVLAEADGTTIQVGTCHVSPILAALMPHDIPIRGSRLSGTAPKRANIILRASREAAAESVDLFEVWGGGLRFENVPVEQPPETQPTAPGLRTP